jgi:pyruvate dehydrogenase E1 component beta subunit
MGNAVFMYAAMDQVISQVAKNRYMFGGQRNLPLVIRCRLGYGGSIAAHHSDRPYPMFMNVPGLKIALPARAVDAKGLLKQAIRDDDPVMVFEDDTVAFTKEDVPESMDPIPLGQAAVRRVGGDVSVVALAGCVRSALTAADLLAQQHGIEAEIIDPRTLVPLDGNCILESVRKTGRLVVTEPAARTCGAAAEIAALVVEEAFAHLRGPVVRVTAPDIPIPFSPSLERPLYPDATRIAAAVQAVVRGDGVVKESAAGGH